RDRSRRRTGDAALSPAARWRVVDRSRRAARGCWAVGAGDDGGAGRSRSAGRANPRDGDGEREGPGRRWRRDSARADARSGGADRGGRRTTGGCGGGTRGGGGDENGERAARAAVGDGPDGTRRGRAGGRKRRFAGDPRSEEHTSELQSRGHLVCRLLLEKKNRCL